MTDLEAKPSANEAPAATVTSASASEPSRPSIFFGFSLWQAVFALVWPLAVVAGVYFYAVKPRLETIEYAVRARPAIKVVNVDDVLRAGIAKGMDSEAAIRTADAQFRELGEHGYIVLNNNHVLAAPKAARLP